MDEKKPNRYGFILAVACLAVFAAAFVLWLYGSSLVSTSGQKVAYADICANPDKLGLPTKDAPLPEHVLSAIEIAEGSYILLTVVRHAQPSPPKSTMGFVVTHYLTALKLWLTVDHRNLTEFVANCGYFGRETFGVSEAAQTYLGKPLSKLTLGEATLLAGLLREPWRYDPDKHPERARQRRDTILNKMFAASAISQIDLLAAKQEPVIPIKARVH